MRTPLGTLKYINCKTSKHMGPPRFGVCPLSYSEMIPFRTGKLATPGGWEKEGPIVEGELVLPVSAGAVEMVRMACRMSRLRSSMSDMGAGNFVLSVAGSGESVDPLDFARLRAD